MDSGVSDARITIHFNVHEPIELVELTLSFQALAREYKSHIKRTIRAEGAKIKDWDVSLYVTKIENNCIFAELAGASAYLGQLFSTMDYINIFTDFVKNIKSSIDYFKEIGSSQKPDLQDIPYNKSQTSSIESIVKIVSETKGGELGLGVVDYAKKNADGSTEILKLTLSQEDAKNTRRGTQLVRRALDETMDADEKGVLMYFHTTHIDETKLEQKTGYKGIIKEITEKPLSVIFVSDLDRERVFGMVTDAPNNIYKSSYLVDVNVQRNRHDSPTAYRVIRLHEIIPD